MHSSDFKVYRAVIFHNILWSRYKGEVFSALWDQATGAEFAAKLSIEFVQIAETERARVGLSAIDLSYHRYPYTLLHSGAYEDIDIGLSVRLFFRILFGRYDIVVLPGYSLPEHWAMLLAAKLIGSKTYVFCDSTKFDRPQLKLKGLLKSIFFRACGNVFCYGTRSRDYVVGFGVKPDRAHIRCQAAALPKGYNHDEELVRLKSDTFTYSKKRFLYVGRLSAEKNLGLLLMAFKQLIARDNGSLCGAELRLDIVGDGPQRQYLVENTRELQLDNHVAFHGSMSPDSIAEFYRSAYFLILPSLSEPWGLVVNEAFSFGCPAIVSDRCGCAADLIVEGATGYSFDPSSCEDLVSCLVTSLESISNRREMALKAFSLINQYSPDRAAAQILKPLLEDLR